MSRIDWGQRAAWGVSFSIFVGGILNVTWTISRITILVYLALGFLLCLFDLFTSRPSIAGLTPGHIRVFLKDKIFVVGVFTVLILALLQYGGWVFTQSFNVHDDFHAYFVYPNKMLQTGSMGPDPFSQRRIVNSLGGQSFLHTFVLSVLSEENLKMIDPGLGMVMAIGLILGHLKNKGVAKRWAALILLFFLFVYPPMVNIAALMVPLALFISFYRTLDWLGTKNNHFACNSFIVAMITASICALKSPLIPTCAIIYLSSYLFFIIGSRFEKKAIYEFFMATILVVIFLTPWMISMYQSSGTLLYPILGKGYFGSAYDTFLLPWSELTISGAFKILLIRITDIYFISLVYLGSLVIILRFETNVRGVPASFLLGAGLGALILNLVTGGYDGRHPFPFMLAAIIMLMITVLANTKAQGGRKTLNPIIVFIVMVFACGIIICNPLNRYVLRYYRRCVKNIESGLKGARLFSREEISKYTRMQQSIPKGETVLTRLDKPFFLDFMRNKIFIVDYPGGASLPPGMPFFKGPEALAEYLLSKSIRYAAYSYANEANFPRRRFGGRISVRYTSPRMEALHTFDFQDNLKKLGDTRKRIYDDGNNFVLDLSRRSHNGEMLAK